MRPPTDVQAIYERIARRFKFARFVHKEIRRDYATITDDIQLAIIKNTGRDRPQNEFLSFKYNGVPCIGAAGESSYDVVAWRKIVDDLSFSFIAEDNAQQSINFSLCHRFCLLIVFCSGATKLRQEPRRAK